MRDIRRGTHADHHAWAVGIAITLTMLLSLLCARALG